MFAPSDATIDQSLDARKCLGRLARHLTVERRPYPAAEDDLRVEPGFESVAVLAGLSGLALDSGYMEMELDTIFVPQNLLRRLRGVLEADFPLVAIVDDAYSGYITAAYLKAGASAVVGASGALFGVVTSRIGGWEQITPYINAFPSA